MDRLSQHVFNTPYSHDELDTTRDILVARSTDRQITAKSQYGGTVTALLSLALEKKLIQGAVMAKMSSDKISTATLAKTTDEVLQCAGSNYMACPVLGTYNKLPKDSNLKLGIVATPCQVLALTKMRNHPPQNRNDISNVQLVIGLFCTWALSPDSFHKFLKEKFDIPKVAKFDIPPPPANRFDIFTASGTTSLPLDDVRKYRMPTCAYCLDMTAEFADLSIGAAEGIEGWNTVIVRTEKGARLLELAKSKGKLETDKLPPQNLAHLKEAAWLKKKRALQEIVNRTGNKKDLLYLGLSQSLIDMLLG
jgi:coenzyme F420 hydrogenase subunit beta